MHGEPWWHGEGRVGAAPLYATRRTPALSTDGPQIRAVAAHLGTPLLPWQSYAADLIGETRPDGSREHQVVVISVPRQTGKTTLIRAVATHRCAVTGRDFFYTAQTGQDARARFDDMVKGLEASAFRRMVKVRRSAGSERIDFPVTGAQLRKFAPTPESLHGYTPPTVCLDEAFAHDEETGDLLMGAIGPAQITIRDRQLLIVSTAGHGDSVFLNRWVETAMVGTPRVAGLIWGATDQMDPFSLDTITTTHPGIGFELNGKVLDAADVLAQADTHPRAEYERAYLNRATRTRHTTIPAEQWRPLAARPEPKPPETTRLVLAYDVAPGGAGASIVAVWRHRGHPHAKVVMAAAGSGWLPGALVELVDRWTPATVTAHDRPPTREVTDTIERAGVTVDKVSGTDFVTATGAMLTRIRDARFSHDGSPQLETAFLGVSTRPREDGVVLSRRMSTGDVSAAFATTVGCWALDHAPQPAPAPVIRF